MPYSDVGIPSLFQINIITQITEDKPLAHSLYSKRGACEKAFFPARDSQSVEVRFQQVFTLLKQL